jgi:type I restriction enzyme M protein
LRGAPHPDRSTFSITLDPYTLRSLKTSFDLSEDSNSENLFLERWYQLLKPRGRLGVVLPESFFSTRENLNARLFLFAHFRIKAIVSLPKEAFEPWTPTRTSLLFAEKRTIEEERSWKDKIVKWEARGLRAKRAAQRAVASLQKSTTELQKGYRAGKFEDFWRLSNECGLAAEKFTLIDSTSAIASAVDRSLLAIAAESDNRRSKDLSSNIRELRQISRWLQSRIAAISVACDVLPKANRLFGFDNDPITLVNSIQEVSVRTRQYLASLRRLDHRVWAFRKIASAFDSPFFLCAAEDIGYRRTKRGETERPNALFVARTRDLTNGSLVNDRVLNLELSAAPWEFDFRPSAPSNLASQLRTAITWSVE